MTLYKITGPSGEAIHGGSGRWLLPEGDAPGPWMPHVSFVHVCRSGYHLVPIGALGKWLPGDSGILWEAEGRGLFHKDEFDNKVAFPTARLIRKVGILDSVSMPLAAADVAEKVLPLWSRKFPNDDRPAKVIEAVRDFVARKISYKEFTFAFDESTRAPQSAQAQAGWVARAANAAACFETSYGAANALASSISNAAIAAIGEKSIAVNGEKFLEAAGELIINQARLRMEKLDGNSV